LTHPPLSTVRIPREKLGDLACQVLRQMLAGKKPGSELVLDTELAILASTATAPLAHAARRALMPDVVRSPH
jgi:DNA-binding LacI/PurR family transcriptional regulator